MTGSYDRDRAGVRARTWHAAALSALVCLLILPAAAQAPSASGDTAQVRLQLRVFDGTEDVTRSTRVMLYPRGQRSSSIPLTLGPDHAYEATVPVGFYDIQAVREQKGQVSGIRWMEQVLVQRYPDEYGRHLQVLNFRPEYGALQIRPAQDAPPTRGWTATAFAAGNTAKPVAQARAVGADLLVVVPAGRYDVRVALPNGQTTMLSAIDIPADRTRLRTWSPASSTP